MLTEKMVSWNNHQLKVLDITAIKMFEKMPFAADKNAWYTFTKNVNH